MLNFKGGKKKSALLYPMSPVEVIYYKRPESDLLLVHQFERISESEVHGFHPIQSSIAFFMADVLKNCMQTDQGDAELFAFLREKITQLERNEHLSVFPILFLVELSTHLGIEPLLEDDFKFFDMPEGRFTREINYGSQVHSGPVVQELYKIFRGDLILDESRALRKEILGLLLSYYQYHISGFNVDRTLEVLSETLHS
jgi:DNA repair protein RecO (recombination protein O)